MLENLMVPPANTSQWAKSAAYRGRGMLLASTMLLTLPHLAWAQQVYDTTGNAISADLNAAGPVIVGQTSDGDLTIKSGAELNSNNSKIGKNDGVKGAVTVTGVDSTSGRRSSWINDGQFHVGESGEGKLTVSDGGYVKSLATWIATFASGVGNVTVTGQGSEWSNDQSIYIGPYGAGSLSIEDGGLVTAESTFLGGSSDGTGNATVTGQGSTLKNTSDIYVGGAGTGSLMIQDGGFVKNQRGFIGLTAGGVGAVTVTGTYSIWENDSNLTIGNNGSGTLTIADGAVVSVGAQQQNGSYDGTTYIAKNAGSTGTLIIGAAEGQNAARAGTLKTDTIKFSQDSNSGAGTILFNHTGSDYVFSAGMVGYGEINQLAGVTTLSGDSSDFFGRTAVRGGTLYVDGALGGALNAYNGGTIGGTGTIGTTTINDGGTLSPGGLSRIIYSRSSVPSQIGTLTVKGDLLLKDGSTYAVDLNSTASDLTEVSGTATIENGAGVNVTSLDNATSYQATQTYKIISTGDGLSGTFTELSNTASAFLDITTSYDNDNAYLNVALKSSGGNSGGGSGVFQPVAKTSNQRSVASALDTLDQTSGSASLDLYNKLLPLSADEARVAYQQLSGDVHATAQGAFIQTNRAVNSALNSRVRAVTDGVAAPSSMALGYAEEKESPVKDDRFAAYETKKPVDPDRFATWINGFGSWGKVSGVNGESDTDISNGGVIVGGDVAISNDWRVGVLGGYSRSFFDTDSSNGSSTNYHVGAYSGAKWGPVAFRSGANYTWHNIDTTRHVTALGQTLSGDYDASSLSAYGELAYRLDVGKSALEPFAALAHTRTKTDGFSETGGSAALTVDSSTLNTTFTTVGLRTSTDFDVAGIASVARGTIGWLHAFGDVDPVSSARFLTGDSFAVSSTPIDRNAALLEAGVDFTITPASTISLSYNGQIGSNAYDHGANAKFRVKF